MPVPEKGTRKAVMTAAEREEKLIADTRRGIRKGERLRKTRKADPSAKRLGTYQTKPSSSEDLQKFKSIKREQKRRREGVPSASEKTGVKAKVKGAAKTVGRRAAGFLAGHRLVRGARAAAGSKVGKAVGRGIKEIATSRRPPTRPPQIGRRLYERFRSAPRSARKRSK